MVFFFNDTATTEIYTLSLHDALPISSTMQRIGRSSAAVGQQAQHREPDEEEIRRRSRAKAERRVQCVSLWGGQVLEDRKSTRLNSSHANISYAVFCLKKKN